MAYQVKQTLVNEQGIKAWVLAFLLSSECERKIIKKTKDRETASFKVYDEGVLEDVRAKIFYLWLFFKILLQTDNDLLISEMK